MKNIHFKDPCSFNRNNYCYNQLYVGNLKYKKTRTEDMKELCCHVRYCKFLSSVKFLSRNGVASYMYKSGKWRSKDTSHKTKFVTEP